MVLPLTSYVYTIFFVSNFLKKKTAIQFGKLISNFNPIPLPYLQKSTVPYYLCSIPYLYLLVLVFVLIIVNWTFPFWRIFVFLFIYCFVFSIEINFLVYNFLMFKQKRSYLFVSNLKFLARNYFNCVNWTFPF